MRSWLAAAALAAVLCVCAEAKDKAPLATLPVLLTHVKIVEAPPYSNTLCGSPRLKRTLENWAFRWVAGRGDPPLAWVDFGLHCGAGRAVLVQSPAEKEAAEVPASSSNPRMTQRDARLSKGHVAATEATQRASPAATRRAI